MTTTAFDVDEPLDQATSLVRFGLFELNLGEAELRREGRRVALQHQPFELLCALLEQPGELVLRDTLRQRLWPAGVTVDFDQSLNKTVAKLRDALGDRAESPRFIQTVPKRGYRFIAPVTAAATRSVQPSKVGRAPSTRARWGWASLAAAAGLAILALRRD